MTDFSKRMTLFPDEELLRIANPDGDDDYLPEATAAARAELRKRGVSEQPSPEIAAVIEAERAAMAGRSDEPLSNRGWIAFAIFGGFLIVTLPAIILLRAQGYHQKAKDAVGAMLTGLAVSWLLLAALVLLISFLGR